MALYGYARVSTKQQELTGNGLEVQVHALLGAGVPENNIYKDAATGATLDRPSFEELRSILKSGDTLVVTKFDRIARSASQGIQIIDDFLTTLQQFRIRCEQSRIFMVSHRFFLQFRSKVDVWK